MKFIKVYWKKYISNIEENKLAATTLDYVYVHLYESYDEG